MDGRAIIVEGFKLEVNRPVTSGGLDHRDIADLLDVAEVLVRTSNTLSDEERERKPQEIRNMRAILHYRFDRSCDHRAGSGCIMLR